MTASADLPNKFTGKEHDDDFGLNWDYFGARYYDAVVGRFLSVDPSAAEFAAWNPYNYAIDNPLRVIDPDGRDIFDVIGGFASAITDNNFGTNTGSENIQFAENQTHFEAGQAVGDIVSIVEGVAGIVGGAALAAAGLAGDGGSGVLAATGVGLPAAVPAVAVSTAAVGTGIGLAKQGGTVLNNVFSKSVKGRKGKDFAGKDRTTLDGRLDQQEGFGKRQNRNRKTAKKQGGKDNATNSGDKTDQDVKNALKRIKDPTDLE